jgi:hypothetical protein
MALTIPMEKFPNIAALRDCDLLQNTRICKSEKTVP